jgi:hypothetical protein
MVFSTGFRCHRVHYGLFVVTQTSVYEPSKGNMKLSCTSSSESSSNITVSVSYTCNNPSSDYSEILASWSPSPSASSHRPE